MMTLPRQWLKNLLPHGLLGRSLLIIMTPMVLLQLVTAYVFYTSHWDTVARRLANGLAGDIGAVIEFMRVFPDPETRLRALRIASAKMELDLRFLDGGIMPNTGPDRPRGFMEEALFGAMGERVQRPFTADFDLLEREVIIRVQLSDGVLEVYAPKKRLFTSTTYIFVLWMIGTALLLFGIATVFMRNQVRSVRKLAAAADAFGKGDDLAADIKSEGASEVRQAAHAFNQMRARIRRQIQQRTQMLAGVSHDLRTPLTRMKLQLAMMRDTDGRAELEEDVHEMEAMVEGYLAFARGEGGEPRSQADLSVLAEDVVNRFRRSGRLIDLHCEGSLTLSLKPHAVARAIGNLIGNALRHAEHVAVRTGRRGEVAEIIIDDDGPGIPPDRREEMFRPFTRLDSSRNAKTGGVGLGLTIARDVARGHGGELLLEDSPQGGLRARLRLPV